VRFNNGIFPLLSLFHTEAQKYTHNFINRTPPRPRVEIKK